MTAFSTIQYTSIENPIEPYFQNEEHWGVFDAKGVLVGVSVDSRFTSFVNGGSPEEFFADYRAFNRKIEAAPKNLLDDNGYRLLHAILGLADEIGELAKAIKSHIWYGKPLDLENVKEECGDLNWYLDLALDAVGFTQLDAIQANMRKLSARYPEGHFTTQRANKRDLQNERSALTAAEDAA